jgi:hypothetical protein
MTLTCQDTEKGRQLRSQFIEIITVRLRFPDIGSAGGVFPFAKIYETGEQPHKCGGYLLRFQFACGLAARTF